MMGTTHDGLELSENGRKGGRAVRASRELGDEAVDNLRRVDRGVGLLLKQGDGARKLADKGKMPGFAVV